MTREGRVVFLTTGLGVGGAETQIVRIAEQLRDRGWAVSIVSLTAINPKHQGTFPERLAARGVPVVSLGIDGALSAVRGLYRLVVYLRREWPDVLVTFMVHANLLGRVAAAAARVPRVISSVRSENFGGRWRYAALRVTDRLADATVTNSRRVAEGLIARGTVRPERMHIVPNGVATDEPPPDGEARLAMRRALGVPNEAFLWMAIGNLVDAKDYPTLLRAFARLQHAPGASLLRIIGEGPLAPAVDALARSLGLAARVELVGFRSDASRLVHCCDAFVLSSKLEGMPNALIEALLAARPCVATNVGGVPELIQDGASGVVVPPGDADGLAAAMDSVARMPAEARRDLGARGRARVVAELRLEHVVDQWERLLRLPTAPR